MWHAKEPSLLNGHECRAKVNICSPSPVLMPSPYEWKILEWDEKTQTNEQTNKQTSTGCNMKFVVKYMDSVHLTFVVFVKKKEFKAEYIQLINIHCFTNCCIHVNLFEIYLLSLGCLVSFLSSSLFSQFFSIIVNMPFIHSVIM